MHNMPSTPDTVLVEHAGLVRSAVGWALRRIGGTQCVIDGDDLAQHARLSLLKAHIEFNGGGDFGAYATQRMRWALLDVIRDVGPVGRHHHGQIKAGLEPAIRHFDITATHIDRRGRRVSFDVEAPVSAESFAGLDREKIRALAEQLPAMLRTVIIEHYYNGKCLREVAELLGVNEPRASQLKKRAIQRLRKLAWEPR